MIGLGYKRLVFLFLGEFVYSLCFRVFYGNRLKLDFSLDFFSFFIVFLRVFFDLLFERVFLFDKSLWNWGKRGIFFI